MFARITLCFVFAFMLLGFVVAGQSPASTTFSLQINGQVRYADSKAPAANVLVRVERFTGGVAGSQMTDQSGKFSFTGLVGQMYTVTIHAPGFKEIKQDVDLLTANTGYVNAMLVRDESAVGNSKPMQPLLTPPVIDSNVPIEAQKEYADAKSLIDSGDRSKLNKATVHLDKAIAIYPKYTEAYLTRGLAFMDLREWAKAESSLKGAIEVTPNAVTAYWALGEVFTRQKKWSEAEDILKRGLALNGSVADGHFAFADYYWEMAPTAKDEAVFKQALENSWKETRRALELNPEHARAHLLAGNLLLKARKPQDALTHFEAYLKLEPKGEFASEAKSISEKIKQALAQDTKNK